MAPGLGEITRGHVPALAQAAVGYLGVAIAEIIVVAQGDVPRHLQRGRNVNVFKRLLPLRIVGRGHAAFIKIVADGNDELRPEGVGGDLHLHGHLHLVSFAVPPPIAKDQKVQTGWFGVLHFGGVQGVRQ